VSLPVTAEERSLLTAYQLGVVDALDGSDGCMSRLADSLGITPGSIAHTVQTIERKLERRLFRRTRGRPNKCGHRAREEPSYDDGDCGRCGKRLGDDIEHVCARAA